MKRSGDLFLNTKVWITFFIMLFVVAGASLWSYDSYQKLKESIHKLSEPDRKTSLIQKTILGITKSENYIKSYILTDKPYLYDAYLVEVEEIHANIDGLRKEMFENELLVQKVDSLDTLFSQKLNFLDAFMEAKRNQRKRNYSNEALKKIKKNTKDSTEIKSKINANLVPIEAMRPTLKKTVIASEHKQRGVWGGIKRLFGGKNVHIDTVFSLQSDTLKSAKVSLDTVTLTNYKPDTVLIKVKEILEEVASSEFKNQNLLSSKESSLLKQDMLLHDEIYKIIDQIKNHQQENAERSRDEGYGIIERSTLAILIIGIAGILIGGILLVAIGRDLSRSFYLSKRLEKEKNKANQLANIKEEFLANMSHEIRTPLNGILGYSEQIHKTKLGPDQKIYAQAISENTKLLMGLVDDILDFSKLNFKKIQLTSQPFYLKEIIQYMNSLFSVQCLEKGIEMKIDYNPDLDLVDLVGDEFRIKQIMINLLSNAVKFTQKGHIQLSVKSQEVKDRIRLDISVSDTGKGIDSTKFKQIFNSFEQEESTITKKYGGTGLGLSIVKGLTDAMKGKITVESKKNELTTFRLQLSLPFKPHTASTNSKEIKPAQNKCYNARVVVIEDDTWNAALIKTILAPMANELFVFKNPEKAMDFIDHEHQNIDLILTDINMPGTSGIDILNNVISLKIKIPVIAITAHVLPEKLQSFYDLGFTKVITKPYNELDITNVLNELFESTEKAGVGNIEIDADDKFDFEKIKEITDNDNELFMEIVHELISGNSKNLHEFRKYLKQENHQALANVSHKMIQTYDSLNLIYVAELLQNIEVYFTLDKKSKLLETAKLLFPKLEEISERLESFRHQSYT